MLVGKSTQRDNLRNFRSGSELPVRGGCLPRPELLWPRPEGLGVAKAHKRTMRPDGADHQWREVPPRELSVDLVADERCGRVSPFDS